MPLIHTQFMPNTLCPLAGSFFTGYNVLLTIGCHGPHTPILKCSMTHLDGRYTLPMQIQLRGPHHDDMQHAYIVFQSRNQREGNNLLTTCKKVMG